MQVYIGGSHFRLILCVYFTLSIYSIQLNGHAVGGAFYNGELENELKRINRIDNRFFLNSDRENCMEMVEKTRRDNILQHNSTHCTEECK